MPRNRRAGGVALSVPVLCALVVCCCRHTEHVPAEPTPAIGGARDPRDAGPTPAASDPHDSRDTGPAPPAGPTIAGLLPCSRACLNRHLPPLAEIGTAGRAPFALPPASAKRRIFGVLHPERPLYLAPDAAAGRLPFMHPQGRWPREVDEVSGGFARWQSAGVLVEILGQRGEFVEVRTEPLATPGVPCHPGVGAYGPYRLRGFAERAALLPVVTERTEVAFADGTSVTLAPGVVVHLRDGGRYYVGLPGLGLTLALPGGAVGWWFEASRGPAPAPAEPVEEVTGWTQFLLGGEVQVDVVGGTVARITDGPVAELETDCVHLRMVAAADRRPAGDVGRVADQRIGSGGGGGYCAGVGSRQPNEPDWYVPAGTAIYWPDGRRAGDVVVSHLYYCAAPAVVGTLRCFGGDPAAPGDPSPVCFEAAEIEERPRFERRETRPRVELGTVMVKGAIEREALRAPIAERLGEIEGCYRTALARRPDLEGRVAVKLVLNADGVPQMVAIQSATTGDAQLEGCIAAAVRGWKWPAAGTGGITIADVAFVLDLE